MSIKKTINIIIFQIIFIIFILPVHSADKGWQYYYKKGMLQYRAEMLDYSILNLEKATDRNNKLFNAFNAMAKIYFIKNKKIKAIDYYLKSLKINNSQPDIHTSLGELYEFYLEMEKAYSHYIKATSLNPEHIKANFNLVRYYIKKDETGKAERLFQKSYEQGKPLAKKYFTSAKKHDQNRNFERAELSYKKAIEKCPAMKEAYIGLFNVYRKQKKYILAADILEKLKFRKPNFRKIYIYLGHIYFTKKFPGKRIFYLKRAIKNLKYAVKLKPDDTEIYNDIAGIYDYTGDDINAALWRKKAEKADRSEFNNFEAK